MKGIQIIIIITIMVLSIGIIQSKSYAKENTITKNESIEKDKESASWKQRIIVSINGGCGINVPTGSVSGNGDQQRKVGLGYAVGMNAGYMVFDSAAVMFGFEYAMKKSVIERTYMIYPMKNSLNMSFVDLNLGIRGMWKMFYMDFGLFYGIKAGTWYEEMTLSGYKRKSPFSGNNELGLYAGVGVMIKVSDPVSIDLGIKYKGSFLYAYKNVDKLRTGLGLITAGATYRFK